VSIGKGVNSPIEIHRLMSILHEFIVQEGTSRCLASSVGCGWGQVAKPNWNIQ
jgi:hypothetical protein